MTIERRFEALEAATAVNRVGWERDVLIFVTGWSGCVNASRYLSGRGALGRQVI